MREKIIYNEIEYSIQGLAKDLEVSPTTLRKYIEEENGDVNKAVQRILDKPIYIYKGTEYTSIFSLSEKTGINRRTLTDAIKERYREVRGKIEVDDIIEEYYAQNHTYVYRDITYTTISEAADHLGLNSHTLTKYLKLADYNLEAAMKLYEESHIIGIIDGIPFKSQQAVAKYLGINKKTFAKYYGANNGDFQKTIEAIQNKEEKNTYIWRGEIYTKSGLAKAMEIPAVLTLMRLLEKNNGDTEKAYQEYKNNRGKKLTYRGKEYEHIKDCLSEYGINTTKYYKKLKEKNGAVEEALDELLLEKKERAERTRRKEQEAIEKRKRKEIRDMPKYKYQGKMYATIAEVVKVSGISMTKVIRLLKEYNNDLDEALLNRQRKEFIFEGRKFSTIRELAEYTGIAELRLGRYIRRFDGNAEKAVLLIRTFDKRKKEINLNVVKRSNNNLGRRTTIISFENTTLRQYCIQHNLNYEVIKYLIDNYGKTPEDAIKHYKNNGQEIPKSWIYEKYGILLKHLLLEENIDYKNIIRRMQKDNLTIGRALEEYVLNKTVNTSKAEKEFISELYYFINYTEIAKDEIREYVEGFYITEEELTYIENIKNKMAQLKRKMLLYEIAEASSSFSTKEMVDLLDIYDITEEEIELIFLRLYSKFSYGILLTSEQEEMKKREEINEYIIRWNNLSQEEKDAIKLKYPKLYKTIEELANKIIFYKEKVKQKKEQDKVNEDIIAEMKKAVGDNVANNAETRKSLEEPIINRQNDYEEIE